MVAAAATCCDRQSPFKTQLDQLNRVPHKPSTLVTPPYCLGPRSGRGLLPRQEKGPLCKTQSGEPGPRRPGLPAGPGAGREEEATSGGLAGPGSGGGGAGVPEEQAVPGDPLRPGHQKNNVKSTESNPRALGSCDRGTCFDLYLFVTLDLSGDDGAHG